MNQTTADKQIIYECFIDHSTPLLSQIRSCPLGFKVLAEVSNEGEWLGCGIVTLGVTTLKAHEGKSIALFFSPDCFLSCRSLWFSIENQLFGEDDGYN